MFSFLRDGLTPWCGTTGLLHLQVKPLEEPSDSLTKWSLKVTPATTLQAGSDFCASTLTLYPLPFSLRVLVSPFLSFPSVPLFLFSSFPFFLYLFLLFFFLFFSFFFLTALASSPLLPPRHVAAILTVVNQ